MGTGGDYGWVVALGQYMDLDEAGYRSLVSRTRDLVAQRESSMLSLAFEAALEYHYRLERDHIISLLFAALDVDHIAAIFLDPKETDRVVP